MKKLLLLYFGLLFLAACLTTCKPTQTIPETFRSDSTIIREVPVIVEIPGQTIYSDPINIDSLISLLKAGVPPSVIERITIRQDPETGNRVGILIDKLGNLTAICEVQEEHIELLQREIERITTESTTNTIIQKPNFFQRIKASLDLIIYTSLIILALIFIAKRFLPWKN